MAKIASNLGNVYKTKRSAKGFARGRPIRKVPGGWRIMAKRRKSGRKTYKKKTSAKRAARGGSVYKVKGGYRVSRKRRKRKRR